MTNLVQPRRNRSHWGHSSTKKVRWVFRHVLVTLSFILCLSKFRHLLLQSQNRLACQMLSTRQVLMNTNENDGPCLVR